MRSLKCRPVRAAGYAFPYLFDEGQVATAQYGPRSTPQLFVIAKTDSGNIVRYTGALDNDTPNTNPDKIRYAENAVTALLANKTPEPAVTKAIGCGVRWKE